jgi:hypothetical protein
LRNKQLKFSRSFFKKPILIRVKYNNSREFRIIRASRIRISNRAVRPATWAGHRQPNQPPGGRGGEGRKLWKQKETFHGNLKNVMNRLISPASALLCRWRRDNLNHCETVRKLETLFTNFGISQTNRQVQNVGEKILHSQKPANLKTQSNEICCLWFFHEWLLPKPLTRKMKAFRIWLRIQGNIRIFDWLTAIVYSKELILHVLLKGIVSRDFWSFFLHQTDPPGTLIHSLKSYCWKIYFHEVI